jgi:hypothetical protein
MNADTTVTTANSTPVSGAILLQRSVITSPFA